MDLDWTSPDFDEDGEHSCPTCNKQVMNARIRATKGNMKCIPCTDQVPVYGVMSSDFAKGCGATISFTTQKPVMPEKEDRS